MNESTLLEHLEQIAYRLGIELRYENLGASGIRSEGGLCKLCGKQMILLNRRDTRRTKIRVLAGSLRKVDLEGVFIPPAVRDILESHSN